MGDYREDAWIIMHASDFRGFTVVQAHVDLDFTDPTKYPILLALPIIFNDRTEAYRCIEALERMIGRLVLMGVPQTVNNTITITTPPIDTTTIMSKLMRGGL